MCVCEFIVLLVFILITRMPHMQLSNCRSLQWIISSEDHCWCPYSAAASQQHFIVDLFRFPIIIHTQCL